jgi:hypothetical protein
MMAIDWKPNFRKDDSLMQDLRRKDGYREMEAKIRALVGQHDLIPEIMLREMSDKRDQVRQESQRRAFYDDLHYRLTTNLLKMVSDIDQLEAGERMMMMVMIEDIAAGIILESAEGALEDVGGME